MEVAALCGLFALVAYLLWDRRQAESAWTLERLAWAQERSGLLTRIQAPEHAPVLLASRSDVEHFVPEDEGEMNMVGMIVEASPDVPV